MFGVASVIIIFCMVSVKAFENDLNFHKSEKNGWLPISRDEILKRIRNTGYNINNYAADDSLQNIHKLRDNAIKVVTTEQFTQPFSIIQENKHFNETIRETKKCTTGICLTSARNNNDSALRNGDILQNSYKNSRRSKAIMTETVKTKNTDVQERQNIVIELDKTKLDLSSENKQESKNTYEVIENADHFNSNDVTNETKNIKSITGYSYQNSKTNNDILLNNNLTSSFFNILSQYNIKPEDNFPNYILSRKKNIYDLKQKYKFLPIPIKIPRTYNSQNHLPVDPLIAVFLFNYGYYLPNYYGQHNNYRNLYGYLASNNNHNNLPFGLYKIFSDTDSSN